MDTTTPTVSDTVLGQKVANVDRASSSIHLLGSKIDLISITEIVDHIEGWISGPVAQCRRITVAGFHGLWEAHVDPRVRSVLNGAELWVPDGVAPILAARILGHRRIQRTPGVEIMREFLTRAAKKGYSSYFLGDTEQTLERMSDRIGREFPGHRIAGKCSLPFKTVTPDDDRVFIEAINRSHPDVLWVALGLPKQELWIQMRLAQLKVPVAIGVGAAFGFIAGTVPRCPDLVGRMGLEWAYRLAKEPKKLWRRDFVYGPQFVFRLALELAGLAPRD